MASSGYSSYGSQNAIGAYRTFQKTSFSCSGRPSGYYADVETGCQRMLICDHWYMVNCSKAEKDYTANLLIGQRDKPFVNDGKITYGHHDQIFRSSLCTDYSVLNQIYDNTVQKLKDKNMQLNQQQQATGQQRWKIPAPSRIILPPSYEPQIVDESSARPSTRISYYTRETTTTTRKPSSLQPISNFKYQTSKFDNVAALHNRHDDHLQFEHDDLGTSHSTRYNTSSDFNSAEDRFAKTPLKSTTQRNQLSTTT
ncbi:hypothetical protein EVAR_69196_1 [Eumeta japonica]|uniref:Uncharacterized protein n=1 Tax=Eumeta variegata TaxID=151549 RepID=A0A4C1T1Q9_EUMVA|nr:hypothetical protein EVAR_69196_1 [Eumeta japonica]